MNRYRTAVSALIAIGLMTSGASAQPFPTVKGRKVVAVVQGEGIALDDFNEYAKGIAPGDAGRRAAERRLLDRMINLTLIAQEARRMGVDKLPEHRRMIDAYARVALREELVEQVIKDLKPSAAEVDAAYQASVRQWKTSAVLLRDEPRAREFATEVATGKDLVELGRAWVADGRAMKLEEGVVLKRESVDPAVGIAVAALVPGATTPVIATKAGFVVGRLEEFLHPENPEARATAERTVLARKRQDAVAAFDEALRKKSVTVDEALLKALDYEADAPGFEALRADRRPLAQIKGDQPITVGELTEELKFKFFHGAALAAQGKRLNAKKEQTLDALVHRRVFRREALRRGLDKSPAYRRKLQEYEQSALFQAVLTKVIAPPVTVKDEEVRAAYERHAAEYATPEMIRLASLVFVDASSAESAADALRKGADLPWVASRAEGQVDPNAKGVVAFEPRPIIVTDLPDGARKAVAGVKPGDVRLWTSPERHVYVLAVQQVVEAGRRPYADVKGDLARKLLDEKIEKAIEEYAGKLRALSEVKVYLKPS